MDSWQTNELKLKDQTNLRVLVKLPCSQGTSYQNFIKQEPREEILGEIGTYWKLDNRPLSPSSGKEKE